MYDLFHFPPCISLNAFFFAWLTKRLEKDFTSHRTKSKYLVAQKKTLNFKPNPPQLNFAHESCSDNAKLCSRFTAGVSEWFAFPSIISPEMILQALCVRVCTLQHTFHVQIGHRL